MPWTHLFCQGVSVLMQWDLYLFDAKGTPWRMMLSMSQRRPSCIELSKNQTRGYDFSASLVPSQVMKEALHVKSNPNRVDKLMRDVAEMAWLKKRDQTYATCLYEISEQVQFSLNKVYLLPKWTYWHQTNPVLCKTDWSWSLLVGNEGSSHGIPEVPVHWSITDTLGKNGELEPSDMCSWVGIDIVHYNDKYYLTLIDCGFTRFTNWEIAALEGFSQYNWPFEGHILQMLLFH